MNYFIYNFLTKFIYILFFLTIICKYKQKIIYYKNNIRYIKDVLFIHGYDKKKDELSYKCFILNKIEELNASFIESSEYFYLNFEPNIVSDYRVIIISSTPLTKKIEEAIILAKKLNKKIIIDINDFIFNKKYKNSTSFVNCLFQNEKKLYNETSFEIGKMLRLSDAAIISNEYLSNKLEDYVSKVFIKRNYANEEIWSLSQKVQKERNKSKLNSNIIIGYFCNCDNCGSDLEVIKNVLLKILKEFKNSCLLLVGYFSLPNYLKEFSSRIIFKNVSNLKKLLKIFSNFDLNIIPLEKNIFNNIKNENSWVLASLVKVPTLVSNYGVLKQVIKHNETGLLCSKEDDWYLSLKTLIINKEYREYLGENAYKYCEIEYNTI